MEIILKYFPNLNSDQLDQIAQLDTLYRFWNERINLVSRKDMEGLYEKHILHSISIAKIIRFTKGSVILDVGTGGGFPGIPLAIIFPEIKFNLIDSIGKKINVVQSIAKELKLDNVTAEQIRAEQLTGKYDFVVSRAVTDIKELMKWTEKNISTRQQNALPNGLLCLKGGNLDAEIRPFKNRSFIFDLNKYFTESFFETKKLLYISV
jgi:16S rRNA (guanine527-N7)-methyltransferase